MPVIARPGGRCVAHRTSCSPTATRIWPPPAHRSSSRYTRRDGFEPALRETLTPEFYDHIAPRTERSVHAAAEVITPSQAARRDLVSAYGLDPERVHAVHHGVDSVFAANAQGGRARMARARGGREAPYVLYALHPRKNLGALRDAMAHLAAEGLVHVLVIAGGPAPERADSSALDRAASAELPGAPDRVARLREPTDAQLASLMVGADAFCLPSLHEGFGLTALEAMACGAPVVVSDRGALPEVVGDAGLVAEPTPRAHAAALRRVLGDPAEAQRLGAAGAARARSFTWEQTGWLARGAPKSRWPVLGSHSGAAKRWGSRRLA